MDVVACVWVTSRGLAGAETLKYGIVGGTIGISLMMLLSTWQRMLGFPFSSDCLRRRYRVRRLGRWWGQTRGRRGA